MSPIHFKLVASDGHIRRLTFENLPPWHELSAKLNTLYAIPVDKVGISYVDNDNDEITASSNEELQDYYQTSFQPGKAIRFKVLDLSAPRDGIHSDSSPPISTSNRNTFGQDSDNLDFPDWQRFNITEYLDDGPHAFVEIVNSDSSIAKSHDHHDDVDSEGGTSTVQPVFVDKGKQRASSPAAAFTASVLDDTSAQKYPIHIMNMAQSTSPAFAGPAGEKTVCSTPNTEPTSVAYEKNISHDDPPVPAIEPESNASASLTNDVAGLLSSLSSVISSHPELSEGIRNVVHNAVNGRYWQAHRSALSQAANEIQQSTGQFEQEAAHRVSEALGSFFRSFSQATDNENGAQSSPPRPMMPESQRPFPWYQHPPPGGRRPWGRRHTTGFDPHRHPPWHIPPWFGMGGSPVHGPPPPPPPPPFGLFAGLGSSIHNNHFSSFPPPLTPPFYHTNVLPLSPEVIPRPPSPPPGLFSKDTIPNVVTEVGPASEERAPPLPPPLNEDTVSRGPPAPFNRGHSHGHRGRHNYRHGLHGHKPLSADKTGDTFNTPPLAIPQPLPRPNPFLPHTGASEMSSSKPNSQQLRAQVEEAKRLYKEQKEIYRREREERKNEKGGRKHDDPNLFSTDLAAGGNSHIVGNAWGLYPRLEMYSSGPRRYNTHLGHGTAARDDLTSRTLSRIARRLSDMGFSENSHPDLPAKIKAQISSRKVITKEEEDDIVTNLLEELLALSSKSPIASGSGAKAQTHNEEWGL